MSEDKPTRPAPVTLRERGARLLAWARGLPQTGAAVEAAALRRVEALDLPPQAASLLARFVRGAGARALVVSQLVGIWVLGVVLVAVCVVANLLVYRANTYYSLAVNSTALAATEAAGGVPYRPPSQPPTRTPYQTPVLSGPQVATATFLAQSGGFIPAELPGLPAPTEPPLPTLAPRTTQPSLPGVGEGPVSTPEPPPEAFQGGTDAREYRVISQNASSYVEIAAARQDDQFFSLAVRYIAPDNKPVMLAQIGDPDAFYIVSEGVRYPLVSVGTIPLGEARAMRAGESLLVTLHFDPLRDPTQPFNLVEGEHTANADTRYWDVFNIQLQPKP